MRIHASPRRKVALFWGIFLIAALCSWTQGTAIRPLITEPIDESKLTVLRGNTHPLARAEFDRGLASDNLPIERMLLVLKRNLQQEAALEKLMAQQLDRSSPNYHKWLTPAQFGQMFGPSDQDIEKITAWLRSHGFVIENIASGRTTIEFSGDAAQVQSAFHTAIHKFVVNGEEHWANVEDPAIPAALMPAVAGVRSLHNFSLKPMSRVRSGLSQFRRPGSSKSPQPKFNVPSNGPCGLTNVATCFLLGPADFATIYNLTPQYTSGIDGTGETIAVLNDSNINLQDDADFRSQFGLPAKAPVVTIPSGCTDPGLTSDEVEAILDVEWSGAVAKNATINLVTCKSTAASFGGDLAATAVVNAASPPPIISYSFGLCELFLGTSGNSFYNTTWQQAATEGISVFISTGDNGSANCDPLSNVSNAVVQPAQDGLAVNGVGSTPFNTAVGGSEFNDVANPAPFWSGSNGAGQKSALGYIPEMTYNDSCTSTEVINFFTQANAAAACNNATIQADGFVVTFGGSGGLSNCTMNSTTSSTVGPVSSCSGGYAKPNWQTVLTPADGKRDLPDVSLFAGDGTISGSFYVFCQRDSSGINGAACNLNNGTFVGVGGTSVSTQTFAGIMALVDQKKGSAQGLANPRLYVLAGQQTPANCNSAGPPNATCVFNDITVGTITMPCLKGTTDCVFPAAVVGPSIRLGWPNEWNTATVVSLACLLCLGIVLIVFPGKSRRLGTAFAALALAFLIGGAGCAGNGGGSMGSGGGSSNNIGDLSGYNAGTGYDLATGLGSVNVNNLVNDF